MFLTSHTIMSFVFQSKTKQYSLSLPPSINSLDQKKTISVKILQTKDTTQQHNSAENYRIIFISAIKNSALPKEYQKLKVILLLIPFRRKADSCYFFDGQFLEKQVYSYITFKIDKENKLC